MRFTLLHNRHHKVSQSVSFFMHCKTVTILLRIRVRGHFVMSITKNHESHYVAVLDNPRCCCLFIDRWPRWFGTTEKRERRCFIQLERCQLTSSLEFSVWFHTTTFCLHGDNWSGHDSMYVCSSGIKSAESWCIAIFTYSLCKCLTLVFGNLKTRPDLAFVESTQRGNYGGSFSPFQHYSSRLL